jgi:hypothetical protein
MINNSSEKAGCELVLSRELVPLKPLHEDPPASNPLILFSSSFSASSTPAISSNVY